jgi:Raf kinase inhibitor-like YbhB/YbcL family protein
MKLRIGCLSTVLLILVLSPGVRTSGAETSDSDWEQSFRLHSTTFENKTTLPLSTIETIAISPTNPANSCTFNGEPGGDQSPELSWTGAPEGTQSFVVVLYDVTASFTHWGMYNISGKATGLPENAGIANSTFGEQINNDYGFGEQYDGPCPPTGTGVTPLVHHYVFTVYALDTKLPTLPAFGVFLPGAQALYHALLKAGREGHILASASIIGLYSAAAPPGPGE